MTKAQLYSFEIIHWYILQVYLNHCLIWGKFAKAQIVVRLLNKDGCSPTIVRRTNRFPHHTTKCFGCRTVCKMMHKSKEVQDKLNLRPTSMNACTWIGDTTPVNKCNYDCREYFYHLASTAVCRVTSLQFYRVFLARKKHRTRDVTTTTGNLNGYRD